MADAKISALTELAAVPAADDELVIVDKDDTTMAASGTDKRLKAQYLNAAVGVYATWPPLASTPASVVTGVANTWYAVRFALAGRTTVAGLRYRVGTTSNGNVRAALYDNAGAKLADETADNAQAAAGLVQTITFDATYAATPDLYYALVWFSSATATFVGGRYMHNQATGTNATTTPTSITPAGTVNADRPIFQLT